jgi:type I restriction enzyme S subunit
MSEKTINKVPNVPNLRFPEFIYEWTTTSLELLTTNEKKSFAGGPFGSDLKTNDYTLDGVPIIQLSNITEDYLNFTERLIFTSVKKADSLIANNAYPGDLIIAKMMPAGRCCIAHDFYKRYVLGSDAIRVNLDIKKCNKLFMREQINTKNIRKIIASKTAGSTRQRIGIPELKNLKLYTPTIEEQNKIGKFLSMIDERILTQSKIIKEYKSYRNRILHTIYNDLNDFDYISLNQLCSITTGKLDANAMNPNGKYKFFTCAKEDYYIDKYSFEGESLIISGNGEVGLIKYFNGKFDAYQRTYVLQNFIKNPLYIKFALEIELPKKLHREKNVGAMPYIVLSTLTGIKVKIPNKELISKITLIVTSLDKKIAIEEQILNDYLLQKKYLLANMFI